MFSAELFNDLSSRGGAVAEDAVDPGACNES
jgi:hypothetical protein